MNNSRYLQEYLDFETDIKKEKTKKEEKPCDESDKDIEKLLKIHPKCENCQYNKECPQFFFVTIVKCRNNK